ncbi:hypothetical protein AB205_0029460 [Aquarana catesbeiana]|uniref:Uncharacterized protein n=2 Tax=Aquarana catesbeiana TaxID=8400 RepID=A0A2G9R7P5_AQUCT|nr:hypothetical protein AB205_0029460 [Aquarana catesbeiana]
MKTQATIPILLEANANPYIKNKEGESPVDIAERLKFTKILELMKKSP